MKWSKSKKAIESLLADSVKDHVQYHMTRYGRHGGGFSDLMTRAWVTWDGMEIANMSTIKWLHEHDALVQQIREINHVINFREPDQSEGYYRAYNEARDILRKQGMISRWTFEKAIDEFLAASIEDALISDNPVVRAFALFDRRLGKRRLAKLEISDTDDQIVRLFSDLRCKAEGMSEAAINP